VAIDDEAGPRETGQKLSTEQRKRLTRFAKMLAQAIDAQKPKRTKWEKWEKVYHGTCDIPEALKEMADLDVKVPWLWQQGQMIWPRIMDPDPRLDFQPVNVDLDVTQLADACKILCKTFFAADNVALRQLSFIEDAGVRMLGVGKTLWLQRHETVQMWVKPEMVTANDSYDSAGDGGEYDHPTLGKLPNPQLNERGYVLVDRKMIVENRPHLGWVALEDWFPDPTATDDTNREWEFERLWLTDEDLEEREQAGIYKDTKLVRRASGDDDTSARGTETDEEAKARREGKHAVYEGWIRGRENCRVALCDDVLLMDVKNPLMHKGSAYVTFCTQPDPRSQYGTSEMEKSEDLLYATWAKDNQRIKAVNAALNFVVIADPNLPNGIPKKIVPGQVIQATNGMRLEQWQIGAQAALAFQETENYLGAMQQMTGASPLWSATPSQMGYKDGTATSANIQQEEGNKRMMVKKLQFRLFMARVGRRFVQLCHQYLSAGELQRILGAAGARYQLQPEDLPMFLEVIPEAMTESLGIQAERNGLIELINILGQLHGTQMLDGSSFDMKGVIEDVLKSYNRNPLTAFRSPQQVASAQAMVQQAMAQVAPPAQQGGVPGQGSPTQSVPPDLSQQTAHGGVVA
jgi:hypothetical protein